MSLHPGILASLLILVTALVANWAWRFVAAPAHTQRREANLVALSVLVFGALDWALLAALPRLGLSFGPVASSLVSVTVVRITILLVALTPSLIKKFIQGDRRSRKTAAKHISTALMVYWVLSLVLLACEVESMYFEPFDLRTTELHLTDPALTNSRPLRMLHLSDPHVERTTKREREIIERVEALNPDLILLTGDYLNQEYLDDPIARRDAKALLSSLSAPYGVYAVSGTVDIPRVLKELFSDLEIVLLQDQVHRLTFEGGEFYLVGVSNLHRPRDKAAFQRLMAQTPEDAYTILLYHTPDLAEAAAEAGIDLYLAGHTHGGQVRLPLYGALVTFSIYGKKYESGMYEIDRTRLYVSRGLGMEGLNLPRVRFLCPPEIVLINLGPETGP